MFHNSTYFQEFHTYVNRYKEYEKMPVEQIFAELMAGCSYLSETEVDLIKNAFEIAQKAHADQIRKSGVLYITHPLIIALMMLPYRPTGILIAATLLHDTLEDTIVTADQLVAFDPEVANIVEGATKIRNESNEDESGLSEEEAKFETIRKILTASRRDINILFLKIFDRLHNMITIDSRSLESQIRIATETKSVYIPLAKRCGLRNVYHILRGLTMRILEPEKWATIETFVGEKRAKMTETAEQLKSYLARLDWSKKILQFDTEFISPFSVSAERLYIENAWFAVQIVVAEASDCYNILHDISKRQDDNLLQANKISDLINNPRLSGYTGLHSEVIFFGYQRIKIRILPKESYEKIKRCESFEELGNTYSSVLFRDFDLINEATMSNSDAFMQSVMDHILARKIPLHAKTKPLFYLPIKSTALDAGIYLFPEAFPYITGIYRNDEKIPPHTTLENNDIITIELSDTPTLHESWLDIVHSDVSKWKIMQKLKDIR